MHACSYTLWGPSGKVLGGSQVSGDLLRHSRALQARQKLPVQPGRVRRTILFTVQVCMMNSDGSARASSESLLASNGYIPCMY